MFADFLFSVVQKPLANVKVNGLNFVCIKSVLMYVLCNVDFITVKFKKILKENKLSVRDCICAMKSSGFGACS